ncbi:precursor of CEP14-like [Pistacia vera]|uniref:precursor of CEP14-like n=1 Tax=Pistacia vera TaxID=55513 RepID=UPI001263AFD3|nr:precursor of CEP14-like [Pistacia vera]
MASLSKTLLTFLLVAILYTSSLESRKVLSIEKMDVPSDLVDSLVPSALQKGSATFSPSGESYKVAINEGLINRHIARDDRILKSVPSPGIGN